MGTVKAYPLAIDALQPAGEGMQPHDTPDPPAGALSQAALVSLLAFWADAGVGYAYADGPIDRRQAPAPERAPEPPSALPARAPVTAQPPPSGSAMAAEVERARAAADGSADLAALKQAVRDFETRLKPRNAALVFARGAPSPAVLVVGQGPSAEDERAGEPFGGRPGRLLDRMLAAAGLEGRALILTTGFWRAGGRVSPAEVELVCAPFLERAIALARPRAVLIAGEGALRALTGPGEPMLAARGGWLAWRPQATAAGEPEAEPLPALPIFHPDFLIRQPAAKKRAWADLMSLAARVADGDR